MGKKQLAALLAGSLVTWTVCNGLIPLLPAYALRLGAAPATTGYYLSSSYLALAVGTLAAGRLSDRFQCRRPLLIAVGLAAIPQLWLMGHVTDVWQLARLTASVRFLGRMQLAPVSVLAGLFAGSDERGKVFGLLALTGALGALLGGAATGGIADCWGFSTLFACLALFWSLAPLAALFVKDRVAARVAEQDSAAARIKPQLGGVLVLLLVASLAANLASFVALLGRSLVMDGLGLSAAAIASTVAISGAVAIPLLPVCAFTSVIFSQDGKGDESRQDDLLVRLLRHYDIHLGNKDLAEFSQAFWAQSIDLKCRFGWRPQSAGDLPRRIYEALSSTLDRPPEELEALMGQLLPTGSSRPVKC